MIAMLVSVRIKPEWRGRFLEAIETDSRGSREDEPGCFRLDVVQDEADPDHYFFYEVYRDEAALAAHRQQPHYQPWLAVRHEGLIAPPEATRCRVLFPPPEAWRKG